MFLTGFIDTTQKNSFAGQVLYLVLFKYCLILIYMYNILKGKEIFLILRKKESITSDLPIKMEQINPFDRE